MAAGEFWKLNQVWSHISLGKREQYRIYEAVVLSRLMYGLQVLWLGQAARRKLDGFHARCVRKIVKIRHAFYSRISNAEVLAMVDAPRLSAILLERQLGYFGALARRAPSCQVRKLVFKEDLSIQPLDLPRRRGRPKLEWTRELFNVVARIFETHADFCQCVANATDWRSRVRLFSRAVPSC